RQDGWTPPHDPQSLETEVLEYHVVERESSDSAALSSAAESHPSTLFLIHLRLDQIPERRRRGPLGLLAPVLFHTRALVIGFLRLDRDADRAVLAVDADDLHVDLVADLEQVARILDAIDADLGRLEDRRDVRREHEHRFLRIDALHGAPDHAAAI